MAKYERGVYEPPSDDIQVFDGGGDDIDEEGSRLPLLIVIALLVLAAFGGVVWLAYTQGLQTGREGAPRIITADQGPVRTAPQNPGGDTPYQGLKIYEQPAPAETDEAPAENTPTAEASPPAAPPAKPAATESAQAKAEPTKIAPAVAEPSPAKPVVAEPAPAKPVAAKPVVADAAPAPAAESAGAFVLQIGAYKSEDEAKAAWATYQRKHPLVGGYASDVQRVDLGDKGVWYRLRIGSFADKAGAGAVCDKLKADGGGCFPAKF